MIRNDQELEATKERIAYFRQQVEKLRQSKPIRRITGYRQGAISPRLIG
jgi:hypothetical protein